MLKSKIKELKPEPTDELEGMISSHRRKDLETSLKTALWCLGEDEISAESAKILDYDDSEEEEKDDDDVLAAFSDFDYCDDILPVAFLWRECIVTKLTKLRSCSFH